MKIKGYTQLTIHDIDWTLIDNREGKKWAGKTIEKAGIVNKGEMDEQMLLILFTDKTFVCITLDNYTDPDSNIEEIRLQDRWISNLKENLSNINGNIQLDSWVQMLIDFGFYQLTEEGAIEEREYAEYLRLKEKFEKQGEQKSTSKVEPKFKVGDWVIIQESTYQITKAENLNVTISSHGRECTFDIDVLKNAHLWTIQDAKDGDVLVTIDNECPFIYKGYLDHSYPNSPVAYCGIDITEHLHANADKFNFRWTDKEVQPATKEKRDLLFSKMKEAGYEWDAEKKELKKLEQKPAWSEEDELNFNQAIYVCHQHGYSGVEIWLKSFKERMKGE